MPVTVHCRRCGKKLAEIRYLSKKKSFYLSSKTFSREFVHFEEALDALKEKIVECPYCKHKI